MICLFQMLSLMITNVHIGCSSAQITQTNNMSKRKQTHMLDLSLSLMSVWFGCVCLFVLLCVGS